MAWQGCSYISAEGMIYWQQYYILLDKKWHGFKDYIVSFLKIPFFFNIF